MSKEEFTDRLFDTINESNNLPIADIDTDATENTITVYLKDGAIFKVMSEDCRKQHMLQKNERNLAIHKIY